LSDLSFVPRRVGVDLSSESIGFAKAFAPPVEFHNIDVAHLSESFDLVTSVEVLEHVPDEFITEFLRNIGARVREGGHLLVSVPTTARPKHVKHYRHYTECMLREALAETLPHFEIVSAEHIFADTWLTSLYQKLTINRLWTLEAPALSRLIWSKVWASRRSTPGRGAHLVALLRRC
jgi:2-polyprenyl-3-methyl-5-hydroxy-6-metoxy-1,4-benzoquinol methylase